MCCCRGASTVADWLDLGQRRAWLWSLGIFQKLLTGITPIVPYPHSQNSTICKANTESLSPALQPHWHQMLDFCRYATTLPDSAALEDKGTKAQGTSWLLRLSSVAFPQPLLWQIVQILVFGDGRTCFLWKHWGSYMTLFWNTPKIRVRLYLLAGEEFC